MNKVLLQSGDSLLKQDGGFILLAAQEAQETGLLGGGGYAFHIPYQSLKEEKEKEIVEVETTIIDLKQRAQELRLKELAIQRAQDKKQEQEITRLQASIQFIQEQIYLENQRLALLRNNMAFLVLLLSNPFWRGFTTTTQG